VLFVIQLATRAVEIAGVVPEPAKSWMLQVARNLVEPWTGFLIYREAAKLMNLRFGTLCHAAIDGNRFDELASFHF